ncbi:MAG: hypothetical protein KC492_25290 [Myxococcales bacterium]|nr:hypothetical protein [Myxococcales bacterium]
MTPPEDEDDNVRRVHEALAPLREQIVRVSKDFGRLFAQRLEDAMSHNTPSIFQVLGGVIVEAINLATKPSESDSGDSDE